MRPCLRFSGASAGTKSRVYLLIAFLFIADHTTGLYLPDSIWLFKQKASASELCINPDAEFNEGEEAWHQSESLFPVFNRQATSLWKEHLLARSLGENTVHKQLAGKLDNIYRHDVVVTESMLEEGLSNLGDTTNLRRAFRKLVTGRPIKVVTLGGSVTFGHGPRESRNVWINQLYAWINETFPHPDHRLINHAIPAVTSSYTAPCVLSLVSQDADIVLIEFTFNDSQRGNHKLEDPTTRGSERMLRKLMRLENQPGIIVVHYWAGKEMKHNYSDTVEDSVNIILKFYGLMGLSMRDSLRQLHVRNEELTARMFLPEFTRDPHHPSCIGSRYLADLVIGHLQDLAASEVLAPFAPAGAGDDWRRAGVHRQREDLQAIGPPLQRNNFANLTEACILDEDFPQHVRPIQGFQWVNEGRPESPKWGFVARQPGDSLEVDVPLEGADLLDKNLTIGLGFLLSYNHMGVALVECVAGCECRPREFSTWHPYHMSVTLWRVVEATHHEGARQCTLRVTVQDWSKSSPPEYKVKLNSLMISGEIDFIMSWLWCDECRQ